MCVYVCAMYPQCLTACDVVGVGNSLVLHSKKILKSYVGRQKKYEREFLGTKIISGFIRLIRCCIHIFNNTVYVCRPILLSLHTTLGAKKIILGNS